MAVSAMSMSLREAGAQAVAILERQMLLIDAASVAPGLAQ